MSFLRFFYILLIINRYGLDRLLSKRKTYKTILISLIGSIQFWRRFQQSDAVRLRLALEALGPLFVKFGQMLSTRQDLLPPDIAEELSKLQDQVPPFSPEQVAVQVEAAYGSPAELLFSEFDSVPVASASVAQVHFARLKDGQEVALKILRPNIRKIINRDIKLLDTCGWLLEKLYRDGKRLKPREVVAEFARHLDHELDLRYEAANCTQLRRNFRAESGQESLLIVPEVYWAWCTPSIMMMQRVYGTPVSKIEKLKEKGIDLKHLSAMGVEIFFTQVFRDGFFHADMHPGNIFIADDGRYIALDFGIVGTLNTIDQNYLAQNFLAFFQRDYKRVAEIHIESGWAPRETRVDEFESAIRTVCEPMFEKPLKDISFGKVLLNLFQISRAFNVEIQPQLVLLQKTLLNIEGLGRQLDPDLNLWHTAKPFLERWMSEQTGWRGLLQSVKSEAPQWAKLLPQLPRLSHQILNQATSDRLNYSGTTTQQLLSQLLESQRYHNRLLTLICLVLVLGVASVAMLIDF